MKYISSLLLFLLVITLAAVFGGCAYITGEAPDLPGKIASPPRWGWSLVGNTYPTTIIDRNTGELITDVSPEEAFGIMYSSSYLGNPVVIDVRTPQEYAGGHIRDAINIDYRSPAFKDEVGRLDKNFTYIVYCQTGVRSDRARDVMKELGFKYVINMTGGIAAWEATAFLEYN